MPTDTNAGQATIDVGAGAGRVSIVGYSAGDWPSVRDFVARHWRADHPLLDRGLFVWQYRGFGPRVGTQDIRLIRVGGELVGFLGLIPGLFFCDAKTVDGASIALWTVRPDLRDRGLGALALREAMKQHGLLCCVGVNPAALPLYRKLGFAETPALRRWVAPLDGDGAAALLGGTCDAAPVADEATPLDPEYGWDFERLVGIYQRTVMQRFRAGVARTYGYWRWRYASSAGFSYRCFDTEGGCVVARVERVVAPDRPQADRLAVLRLIEILPAKASAWDGEAVSAAADLIRGVMAWGRANGCVLADFQHASQRLHATLQAAGMTLVSDEAAWTRKVPGLFQPLRSDVGPLNAVWRAGEAGAPPISADDLYLVKSDGDMDRPNVWPLPLEYVS